MNSLLMLLLGSVALKRSENIHERNSQGSFYTRNWYPKFHIGEVGWAGI
jgi:hypothetical protein